MMRRPLLVRSFALLVFAGVAGLATSAAAQVAPASSPPLVRVDFRPRLAAGSRRTPAPVRRSQTRQPVVSTKASRWELEVHGGFGTGSNPASGTARLPNAGPFFLLADGITSSRAVSSWYFGDGTALFNQVAAARLVTARMTPLDLALVSETVGRAAGGHVGFRVGRVLNSRFTAEFVLDVGLNHLAFVRTAAASIENSRSNFAPAMTGLNNSTATLLPNPTITSTATISDHTGTQMLLLGAVTFAFTTEGPNVPYLIVGEGAVMDRGQYPSAQLVGDYRLTGASGAPFHQIDTVAIRNTSTPSVAFTFGGGFKREFSRRSGLRVELRFMVAANTMDALLDAQPVSIAGSPTNASILNATNPGLQFSTVTGLRTNLSGSPLSGFTAFEGSGMRAQSTVSIGYFRRF